MREPLKQVRVGGTGVGKTHQNMQFIENVYSNPNNPEARKTLIYDTNMEFSHIKPIAPQDISLFNAQQTIEIRRVLPLTASGAELGMDDKYELLCDIIDNHKFRNGLLYLEDINNYVTNAHTKHLINLLTTNRHKMMDIFINVQTFGAIPPRLWGNVNILCIHGCNDSPTQSKVQKQLSGKVDAITIANQIVQNKLDEDPRFNVSIDFRNMKVTGQYSMNDWILACEQFLALHPKKVRDQKATAKVSVEEAEKQLIYMLTKKYNGNVRLKNK